MYLIDYSKGRRRDNDVRSERGVPGAALELDVRLVPAVEVVRGDEAEAALRRRRDEARDVHVVLHRHLQDGVARAARRHLHRAPRLRDLRGHPPSIIAYHFPTKIVFNLKDIQNLVVFLRRVGVHAVASARVCTHVDELHAREVVVAHVQRARGAGQRDRVHADAERRHVAQPLAVRVIQQRAQSHVRVLRTQYATLQKCFYTLTI